MDKSALLKEAIQEIKQRIYKNWAIEYDDKYIINNYSKDVQEIAIEKAFALGTQQPKAILGDMPSDELRGYREGLSVGYNQAMEEVWGKIDEPLEYKEFINKQLIFINSTDAKEPKDLVLINLRNLFREFTTLQKQSLNSQQGSENGGATIQARIDQTSIPADNNQGKGGVSSKTTLHSNPSQPDENSR
jgi:hypothetical protein